MAELVPVGGFLTQNGIDAPGTDPLGRAVDAPGQPRPAMVRIPRPGTQAAEPEVLHHDRQLHALSPCICGVGPSGCSECVMYGKMSYVAFGAEDRREECIMIAKLLGKLSFTRHYGAYGVHDWGT
ncbi:hypothetical protein [Streptomyces sp. NPDC001880]